MIKKLKYVRKLHDKNLSWAEIADGVNERFEETTNGEALRKWYAYYKHKDMADLVKDKKSAASKLSSDKKHLVNQVLGVLKDNNGRVALSDLKDMGITNARVKPHFESVKAMVRELNITHSSKFKLTTDTNDTTSLGKHIKSADRVIVTTAVTGAIADTKAIAALETYCQKYNAIVIYIPVADPASEVYNVLSDKNDNRWDVSVDRRIAESPHFRMAVGTNVKIANKLYIANIKTSAKQTDPTTGLARIANQMGSIIIGSPKQRLLSVPTSNVGLPRFVMSTGCITLPDYHTTEYNSLRTSFLGHADHVMGAIVIEKGANGVFHFRQLQFNKGELTDLNVNIKGTKVRTNMRAEALVLGDWHSGSTDPGVIKAVKEISSLVKPKHLVVHDGFDGLSINHHEAKNRIKKAKRATKHQNVLRNEVRGYARDLVMLSKLADKVVICKSNHDTFLDRYLDGVQYLDDPVNHGYALELAAVMAKGKDPLRYAVNNCGVELPKNIIWLSRDDDFKVKGVQLAAHGDQGPNGARGSLRNIEASYGRCIIGHSHTPGILREAWQVGTSTYLDLDYTSGPSSWLHSHCIIDKNGGRQLINIILGKWRKK
jgi:hypothetical protein